MSGGPGAPFTGKGPANDARPPRRCRASGGVHSEAAGGAAASYLPPILSRYVAHFIALSASSPFQQGEDTAYQSSRLNTVSAFPLSGQVPFVRSWSEFLEYFNKMRGFGIVES